MATKTTNLGLNSKEKEHVLNFRGHSETVHKTIYRQPDMKKDISFMPRVLNFASESENILTGNTPIANDGFSENNTKNDVLKEKEDLVVPNNDESYGSDKSDESEYSLKFSEHHKRQVKRRRR